MNKSSKKANKNKRMSVKPTIDEIKVELKKSRIEKFKLETLKSLTFEEHNYLRILDLKIPEYEKELLNYRKIKKEITKTKEQMSVGIKTKKGDNFKLTDNQYEALVRKLKHLEEELQIYHGGNDLRNLNKLPWSNQLIKKNIPEYNIVTPDAAEKAEIVIYRREHKDPSYKRKRIDYDDSAPAGYISASWDHWKSRNKPDSWK